jgi:hypothetical protein
VTTHSSPSSSLPTPGEIDGRCFLRGREQVHARVHRQQRLFGGSLPTGSLAHARCLAHARSHRPHRSYEGSPCGAHQSPRQTGRTGDIALDPVEREREREREIAQFVRHSLGALDTNPTRGRAGTLTRAPAIQTRAERAARSFGIALARRERTLAPTNATTSKPDNDSSLQISPPRRQSDTHE